MGNDRVHVIELVFVLLLGLLYFSAIYKLHLTNLHEPSLKSCLGQPGARVASQHAPLLKHQGGG